MPIKPVQLTLLVAIAVSLIAACGSVANLHQDSGTSAGTGGAGGGATDGGTGSGGATGGGGTTTGGGGTTGNGGTTGGTGGVTGGAGAAGGIRVRGAIGALRPSAPAAGSTMIVLNPRLGAPVPASCGPAVCLVRGGIGP